jgi:hypothetical protein
MENKQLNRELAAELPVKVVREVLWFTGDDILGQDPGGYMAAILIAMSRADSNNFAKLSLLYPDYGTAFRLSFKTSSGHELLRDRAKAVLFV